MKITITFRQRNIFIIITSLLLIIISGLFIGSIISEAAYDYPNTYVNTGDSINDFIAVVNTQLGYKKEADGTTKYGQWYGYPKDAWCAMFVSWCCDQADISKNIIKKFCRCSSEADWFKSIDRWHSPEGYAPQAGDIVFFKYTNRIDHVGIVTGSDDKYVYTIEGNYNNSVVALKHKLNAAIIIGYGNPAYNVAATEDISVSYQSHVQSYGWQDWRINGAMSGTEGEAKRLEAIEIKLDDNTLGSIEYRTHVQSYGWLNWVSNGDIAGTTGEAKRLEAIEIRLTRELAEKYDVYYRAHVQSYGWMDWVKNGDFAGTTGESRRLEAIEIKLVEK